MSIGRLRIRGQGGILWRALPVLRLAFRAVGRGWIRFYAWMLNRQERNNSMAYILEKWKPQPGRDKGLYDYGRGYYHAEFLKREGLRPAHQFLDFGCGYGRTAIPLLRFLDVGHYTGVDISAERIRMCHEYVAIEKLEDRKPRFLVTDNNRLDDFGGVRFDFIFAQSVFTHMPAEDARTFFANVHKITRPGTLLIFDHTVAQSGYGVVNVKDFRYPPQFFENLADEFGFEFATIADWKDDLSDDQRKPTNRMLKLVKR